MFRKIDKKLLVGKDIGVLVNVPIIPGKIEAIQTLAQMGLTLARALERSVQVTVEGCNFSECGLGMEISTSDNKGKDND